MAAISPARKAAFDILLAVERGRGHSDELLRGQIVNALTAPDRNLATTLVLGELRWQIWLDRQIRPLLKRPNARLDSEILIALRLGAFQLLLLDRIPAHAAIDESVELAKRAGQRYASGMVNAVLRKLAASSRVASLAEDASAYPAWMVERWQRNYGAEAAGAICRHGQIQPALSLRSAGPHLEAELMAAGVELAPGKLLTAARTVLAGDFAATAAFRAGRVRIQDEGSQLVAEIAAAAAGGIANLDADRLSQPSSKTRAKNGAREIRPGEKMRVLDACAAPGGKTLVLAERLPAARIVACELNPQRLAQLKTRLHAYDVECRLGDAAALEDRPTFNLALADVPCSGTGTLGRNPEIRHRLIAEDLPRQAERQRAILRAVLRAVRPGGHAVYSTCSLEPEENQEVIAAVLSESTTARQLSLAPAIEQMRRAGIIADNGAKLLASCLTPEGALRLIPGAMGTDGFFIALIERRA